MPSNLAVGKIRRWYDKETRLPVAAPEKNFTGQLTFRQFNMILSGSCASFVTLVILTLMFLHATHFSRPNEQQK